MTNHDELYDMMRVASVGYKKTNEYSQDDLKRIKQKAEQCIVRTDYNRWIEMWNKHSTTPKGVKITEKKKGQINARLQTFTEDEIEAAMVGRFNDDWINSKGLKYRNSWDAFWRSDDKVEYWLIKSGEHPGQGDGIDFIRKPVATHPLQEWIVNGGFSYLFELRWLTPEECDKLVEKYTQEELEHAIMSTHYENTPGYSAYEAILSHLGEEVYV